LFSSHEAQPLQLHTIPALTTNGGYRPCENSALWRLRLYRFFTPHFDLTIPEKFLLYLCYIRWPAAQEMFFQMRRPSQISEREKAKKEIIK